MNINFEQLFNTVQECFDYIATYEIATHSSEWRKLSAEQRRWHERNEYHASNQILNLCRILNLDTYRLCTITRAVHRWEDAHHWEKCFPFNDEMNRRIYEYIKK